MRYRWWCEVGKMWCSHADGVTISRWFDDLEECRADLARYERRVGYEDDVFVWDSGVEKEANV